MKDKALCLSQLSEIEGKMNVIEQKLNTFAQNGDEGTKKEKMIRRIENLEKKKSKILINFDTNLRSYIRRLGDRYHNTGVVRVLNALCPGCHVRLPTKESLLLRQPNNYVICSFCGRILLSCSIDMLKLSKTSLKSSA